MIKNTASGRGTLLQDNSANEIVVKGKKMLSDSGFDDNYTELFAECLVDTLDDYAELMGEDAEFEYSLKKKLTKIELKLVIPGDSYDLFECGSHADKRQAEKLNDNNCNTDIPSVSYKYASDENRITISVPLSEKKKHFLAILRSLRSFWA